MARLGTAWNGTYCSALSRLKLHWAEGRAGATRLKSSSGLIDKVRQEVILKRGHVSQTADEWMLGRRLKMLVGVGSELRDAQKVKTKKRGRESCCGGSRNGDGGDDGGGWWGVSNSDSN